MFKQIVNSWPLMHQILHRSDGTGLEARSRKTRALRSKIHGAQSRARFALIAASAAVSSSTIRTVS